MVIIREYRVVLPLTVEEYHVGQLYAVAKASARESTSSDGVEILKNEPYENEQGKGQYTHKIYHIASRLPPAIKALAKTFLPATALDIHEEAWNAYPHCKTVLTSPFLGGKFNITVETRHAPDAGTQNNIHGLDDAKLKLREVDNIDIAFDAIDPKQYNAAEDPQLYKSEKTGRGPLNEKGWQTKVSPVMCCYKLVTVECRIFGVQGTVESSVHKLQKGIFTKFHREVFCWLDEWIQMTIEDIRRMEEETKKKLDAVYNKEGGSSSSDAGAAAAAAPATA
eukprot:TRINITY_DN1832_c0_g1_i1.p1 TRINITY_DN1832_c0_g1~~TRINITY_DN1832_c0_g1_i1.p1  ORF type:complete len:280 (-),score=104.37 TRINITY_DN1832_c0_g1_i1:169-1008(-)